MPPAVLDDTSFWSTEDHMVILGKVGSWLLAAPYTRSLSLFPAAYIAIAMAWVKLSAVSDCQRATVASISASMHKISTAVCCAGQGWGERDASSEHVGEHV